MPSVEEYTLRTAAWKHCHAAVVRLRDTDDDTDAVLGALMQNLSLIRQELQEARRSAAYAGKVAR